MAHRLRSRFIQVLEAVPHAIQRRRREGAGDGTVPSPPPRTAPARPYDPYLVGIKGHLPRTSYWRRKMEPWSDDDLSDEGDNGCSTNSAQASDRGASHRSNSTLPRETPCPVLTRSIALSSLRACQSTSEVKKNELELENLDGNNNTSDANGDSSTDLKIVWPPMVIVMNTFLEKGHDDKWKGMDDKYILDYFGEYNPVKAHHACGPSGQLGMSVLVFESSVMGYLEAERLHKHFVHKGTDKNALQVREPRFVSGGKRQLFGFLARKKDIDVFNNHRHGKSCLNYEMKSYNEMVVMQMKNMTEDNKQLNYLKNKVQRSKAAEETLGVTTQKLCEPMEEKRFVRSKAKEKRLEYEQEMKYQEDFFHTQIEDIHKAIKDEEKLFQKLLQVERSKAHLYIDSGTNEDRMLRKEHVQKFIACQVKDVTEVDAEKDRLIKIREKKKMKVRKEYMKKELKLQKELEEVLTGTNQVERDKLIKVNKEMKMKLQIELMNKELGIERELEAALKGLMEKHKPDRFEASSS